jgi:DNA-directed RNA polymerase subunit RPC12/RpoP
MTWSALKLKCSSCGQANLIFLNNQNTLPHCTYCDSAFEGVELETGSGFIYILSNPYMPGLVKIGFTEKNVFERAKELSTATGVPAAYEVEACFPAVNASLDEVSIHEALSESRVPNREFFRVSLDDALREVAAICTLGPTYLRSGLHRPGPQRWLRCRTCKHEWPIPEDSADPPCPKCGWHISDRLRKGPTKNAQPTVPTDAPPSRVRG